MTEALFMKIFTNILKVLTALAAVAGTVYVIATYGDKIVAWAKKLLNCTCTCTCECTEDGECTCECEGECTCECEAECACEEACECEEAPAEEPAAEAAVEAEEADFEG